MLKKLLQTLRWIAVLALCGAGVSLTFGATDEESQTELHFTAELSAYGSDYKERGGVEPEDNLDAGGEVSLGAALEWETGDFLHEMDLTLETELSTERDSSTWMITPTVEYSLIAPSFILDASVDFNFASEKDLLLGYMLWAQKRLWKNTDYNLNLSGWVYYRDDGRLLGNVDVNGKKMAKAGLNGKIALGAKIDGDTLVARIGPNAKMNLSYKFSQGISLDWNESIFYGLVAETVYDGGEDMDEMKISGDVQLNYKSGKIVFYLTLRSIYRHYFNIPVVYSSAFAENGVYHSVKIGTKIEF